MVGTKNELHLPDLVIEGFRGIDSLTIPQLGRVTLIAGKNSVGKTTILEAVRVYGTRARYSDLSAILESREEAYQTTDEDGDTVHELDWSSLFYGRKISEKSHISIGATKSSKNLTIRLTPPTDEQLAFYDSMWSNSFEYAPIFVPKVNFQKRERSLPWVIDANGIVHFTDRPVRRLPQRSVTMAEINCVSLGPGILENYQLAHLWDKALEIKEESPAIEALKLIFGDGVVDVTMVGDNRTPMISRTIPRVSSFHGRRAMVNTKQAERRVPLRSLGEGAVRLFGVALALANSKGGFLLLDEAENGLHYSVQPAFWRMVLNAARANDVQVLATTHSWDCVRGFAQAAAEDKETAGVYFRVERDDSGLYVVDYPEDELRTAAEHGIETR